MRISWLGAQVQKHAHEAARKGIDETTASCVQVVQSWSGTPHDTGFMKQTFEFNRAEERGGAWVGRWGNVTAQYVLWQEIGARGRPGRHFMRHARDQEYPKLAGRIQAWYRGGA